MICRIVQRLYLGVRYSTEREQAQRKGYLKELLLLNSRVILFLQVKKAEEPGDEATRE